MKAARNQLQQTLHSQCFLITAQRRSFPLMIPLVNVTKIAGNCGFTVAFTEEILNGLFHFLCSEYSESFEKLFIKYFRGFTSSGGSSSVTVKHLEWSSILNV